MAQRTISHCQHKPLGNNCRKCGLFIDPQDSPLKTQNYDSFLNCSAAKYLSHMRQRACSTLEDQEVSSSTSDLLEAICNKFSYSIQTRALGFYLFAKLNDKKEQEEKLWAAACLMVASKAIELDKRVPYFNRYQRYADKSFSQEEYEMAERKIFEEMEFNIQFTTFISFIHFYLTNGIVFKSDGLPLAAIKHIEDQVLYQAQQLIRDGSFVSFKPEELALSLIKQTRIKYRLEGWKKQLQSISGFSEDQVAIIHRKNVLKPLTLVNTGMKCRKTMNLSQNTTVESCPSTPNIKNEQRGLKGLYFQGTKQNEEVEENFVFSNSKFSGAKGSHGRQPADFHLPLSNALKRVV